MKYLKIDLVDRNEIESDETLVFGTQHSKVISQISCCLDKDEFPNIYYDEEITQEALDDAIDTLITYLMQNKVSDMKVDLALRDHQYAEENIDYEQVKNQLDELYKDNEKFIEKLKHISDFLDDYINSDKENR